jgi:Tol biopolymer transport system component
MNDMHRISALVVWLLCNQVISPLFARSFPDSLLPSYIKPVVDIGERADWSHDGKTILYLNKSGGDVYEVEAATKKIRLIAKAPEGEGYWRALYLSNGDYFLTRGTGRDTSYAYILDKNLAKSPVQINTLIKEGPAISRTRMRIAYTPDNAKIWLADIVYNINGVPSFANSKVIIDKANIRLSGAIINVPSIEPQNFRPPDERELTFSAYGFNGSDALLYNLDTGTSINLTNGPCYDEPEGMFPDGQYTCVECDRHNCKGPGQVDIYRYKIDGSDSYVRMTHFNDVAGFKASNPVISDDGKVMAFQESRPDVQAGVGFGIYIFDLAAVGYYTSPAANTGGTL